MGYSFNSIIHNQCAIGVTTGALSIVKAHTPFLVLEQLEAPIGTELASTYYEHKIQMIIFEQSSLSQYKSKVISRTEAELIDEACGNGSITYELTSAALAVVNNNLRRMEGADYQTLPAKDNEVNSLLLPLGLFKPHPINNQPIINDCRRFNSVIESQQANVFNLNIRCSIPEILIMWLKANKLLSLMQGNEKDNFESFIIELQLEFYKNINILFSVAASRKWPIGRRIGRDKVELPSSHTTFLEFLESLFDSNTRDFIGNESAFSQYIEKQFLMVVDAKIQADMRAIQDEYLRSAVSSTILPYINVELKERSEFANIGLIYDNLIMLSKLSTQLRTFQLTEDDEYYIMLTSEHKETTGNFLQQYKASLPTFEITAPDIYELLFLSAENQKSEHSVLKLMQKKLAADPAIIKILPVAIEFFIRCKTSIAITHTSNKLGRIVEALENYRRIVNEVTLPKDAVNPVSPHSSSRYVLLAASLAHSLGNVDDSASSSALTL